VYSPDYGARDANGGPVLALGSNGFLSADCMLCSQLNPRPASAAEPATHSIASRSRICVLPSTHSIKPHISGFFSLSHRVRPCAAKRWLTCALLRWPLASYPGQMDRASGGKSLSSVSCNPCLGAGCPGCFVQTKGTRRMQCACGISQHMRRAVRGLLSHPSQEASSESS
jgi:hypothetical protein